MVLKEFLVNAKVHTYAASGERSEKILEDGSRELQYEDSDWRYRDRYFGFNPFMGEEIVWQGKEVIWGMNYHGRILHGDIDAKILYSFLKKAMRLVSRNRPFRGPSVFSEGEWKYVDESTGWVDDFEGIERIYFAGREVYRLKYHGGIIRCIRGITEIR